MANEAHKEPTMEEILASIRKIISDDAAAPASASEPEPEIANDEEDDVSLEEVMFDEDIREETFEEEAVELEMEAFEIEDFAEEEVPEASPEPAQSFESLLSASRAAEYEAEPEPEPVPEPVAVAPVKPAPAPTPAPAPAPVEKPMSASPAYESASLTDESTANAAAGALGKLISKMDLGTDNTLEGLVRELLRPMIKEWLDANLASIVEEKVEAEVQRISRMAR
ncbi:PopZ family protein [Hyphomonas sp.]|uniref:PopZ family protein n=1 Tax=Hyphomonas sp. TaxID=87 RepID=UPI003529866D